MALKGHSLPNFASVNLKPLVQHRNQLSVRASKLSSNSFFGVMLQHLEVREKQYDKKAYLDFFTVSFLAKEPCMCMMYQKCCRFINSAS